MVRSPGIRVFLAKEISMKALSAVKRFIRDERGVTAIEYGLIAAVIALAVAVSMDGVKSALESVFNDVRDRLNGV